MPTWSANAEVEMWHLSKGVFLALLFLGGCASSSINSFTDPEAVAFGQYSSIVVAAPNLPLAERQAAEQAMLTAATKLGLEATPGLQIAPPTRVSTSTEIGSALAASGATGVVLLTAVDKGTNESYVPPTVVGGGSSTTFGTVTGYGGYYTLNSTTTYTPPMIVGGYTVSKPTASYKAGFFDTKTGKLVWIADIEASGNAFADFNDLATSAANKTVSRLHADGLI